MIVLVAHRGSYQAHALEHAKASQMREKLKDGHDRVE